MRRIRRADSILFLIIVLVGVLLLGIYLFYPRKEAAQMIVTMDGKEYCSASLATNQTIPIEEDGATINVITIEDGEVYMSDATCPDQLCIKQGHKSKDGETIVCLPHRVVVTVLSEDAAAYDSLSN